MNNGLLFDNIIEIILEDVRKRQKMEDKNEINLKKYYKELLDVP